MFEESAKDADFEEVVLDSTIVRAHQHVAGAPKQAIRRWGRSKPHRTVLLSHETLSEENNPGINNLGAEYGLAIGQEAQLATAYQRLSESLQTEVGADQAEIKMLQGQLKVTLFNELLFPEGGWQLHRQGEQTLNKIVPTLQNLTQTRIVVDGYTDDLPIGPHLRARFPSNWQLSAARATSVVQYLQSQGVNPDLMSAAGYGETRPLAANDTPQGRATSVDFAPRA